ncbi:hypothetical protein GTR02_14465 [Kineococcus sp. R8]|uniref:SSI family serine proteinase inhibitor n=1 Tax=Kineococcus siccus TaxID=2696567 RepID=UPI0014130C55|nr:SSI family serine proteinase inhibitor [Kineococcus siccus]NAZ83020.1 hypothetical protein [Kineococcus siccus]
MTSRSTTRRTARAAVVLATTLVVAGLAACGDEQAGGAPVSSSSGDAATPSASPAPTGPTPLDSTAAAEQTLTVTVDDGSGGKQTWTLTCPADGTPGGDHPDAVNACAALAALADPFRPVPKDMACTMIYGGPATATVQGRWGGKDVLATFKRTDGCEISRWNRIAPLLQPGQPVTQGNSGG